MHRAHKADIDMLFKLFDMYEQESIKLSDKELVFREYDLVI